MVDDSRRRGDDSVHLGQRDGSRSGRDRDRAQRSATPCRTAARFHPTARSASWMPFFGMINEQGGIAGRKINFITLDDGYIRRRRWSRGRRLVEEDQVAFLFNTLGTPTNSAIVRYVNQKKVPLSVRRDRRRGGRRRQAVLWWTTGFQPDYRTGGADLRQRHDPGWRSRTPRSRCCIRTTISARPPERPACRVRRSLREDGDRGHLRACTDPTI